MSFSPQLSTLNNIDFDNYLNKQNQSFKNKLSSITNQYLYTSRPLEVESVEDNIALENKLQQAVGLNSLANPAFDEAKLRSFGNRSSRFGTLDLKAVRYKNALGLALTAYDVAKFLQENGLDVDGDLGNNTLAAMYKTGYLSKPILPVLTVKKSNSDYATEYERSRLAKEASYANRETNTTPLFDMSNPLTVAMVNRRLVVIPKSENSTKDNLEVSKEVMLEYPYKDSKGRYKLDGYNKVYYQ